MTDLWVSVAVLGAAVLLSEATRRAAARLLPAAHRVYLLEAASTFQLCSCTHELVLLGETARPGGLPVGLALTYTVTVIHLLTFRGAACNLYGALESVCRGSSSVGAAVAVVACQFGAAVAARTFAASAWSLGLSDVHVRHQRSGFRCLDSLGGTASEAAVVELLCAFTVQAAAVYAHRLDEKLRAPFVAAVITSVVYTGGSVSGAFFNPVLAFSVQFPCSGHTYPEYCFVYWLAPALGTTSWTLLSEKLLPFLSGRSGVGPDAVPVPVPDTRKQKTQ